MGDEKKEGAGIGAIRARGGSVETGRKSRVDPRQGRGSGGQPCNKFPGSGAGGKEAPVVAARFWSLGAQPKQTALRSH